MRIRRRPAFSVSMRISVAPASSEFSRSSLTTEAGRSTTSPAAILFAPLSERTRIRPIFLGRAQAGNTRPVRSRSNGLWLSSTAHRGQELGVAARLAEFVEQQLHRFYR